jgi:hypothetical protein
LTAVAPGACVFIFFFRNLEKFDVREADISKKEQGEKPCSENRVDPIFPKFESDLD